MKTENAPSQGNKLFAAIGVFAMSALLAFGATSTPAGNFKSTPYQNRSATADQTLDRLTGAQGRTVLDGVVTRVKQKAADKAGNPPNAEAYNAYLDAYLAKVDQLDNTTKASLGRDYEFLFQYIYPRVYEVRMNGVVATAATAVVASVTSQASTNNVTASVSYTFAASSTSVPAGGTVTLTWSKVTGLTSGQSCAAVGSYDNGTGWIGSMDPNGGSKVVTMPQHGTQMTFRLICGSEDKSVSVNVEPAAVTNGACGTVGDVLIDTFDPSSIAAACSKGTAIKIARASN
jgi:hypothetical protein